MKSTQTSENSHHDLNRMDFLRLFLLSAGAAFLNACQKALSLPSPIPSATLEPTSTTTSACTALPKFTHTPSSTIALTETPTSTLTNTPTETPTPTEIPIPRFRWFADFESGSYMTGFSRKDLYPECRASVVSDWTGSGRGKLFQGEVLKRVVTPNDPLGDNRHRAYPHVDYAFKEGPYSGGLDLYIPGKYSTQIDSPEETQWEWGEIPWVSVFSMFNEGPPVYEFAQTVNLFEKNGGLYLRLFINGIGWGTIEQDAPEFSFDTWHIVRVDVDKYGIITLYQDGRIVSKGIIKGGNRIGTGGGHAGIYTGGMVDELIVLNDNMWFESYK